MHVTLHGREYHVVRDEAGQPLVIIQRNRLIWDVVADDPDL